MNITKLCLISIAMISGINYAHAQAGPFAPAAGQPGSTAVSADSSDIVGWATGYQNYLPGAGVDSTWQTPELTLGEAGNSDGNNLGFTFDIASLGRGGEITLTFSTPIANGDGYDFTIFENSFSDTFLELAWVEVSSNGSNFFRYPGFSFTDAPVSAFGSIDPTNIDGFAGKYRGGFGTPFDLDLWSSVSADLLDLNAVSYVRIIDIIGDGSEFDNYPSSLGGPHPIYDPFPTTGSAGFDLDAVAVLNAGVNPVPVPAAIWLLLSGIAGMSLVSRFQRSDKA